jgi:hypothetical protein
MLPSGIGAKDDKVGVLGDILAAPEWRLPLSDIGATLAGTCKNRINGQRFPLSTIIRGKNNR